MGWFACLPKRRGAFGRQLTLMRLACAMFATGLGVSCLSGAVSAAAPAPKPADQMMVEADQMVMDKDTNTVSAVGNVQIYYKKRVLQADRVVYNRTTKRVMAEGHAKLTDEKGNITYGKHFDLSDDFRDGFIESVQVAGVDKTLFTSPRVERSGGDMVVLQKGAYTACEPCKDHPERPPFWQVRAEKIIENQQTHVVYFENAWLELEGVPLAYLPYFSAPDPSVTRMSGVLTPHIIQDTKLGFGLGIPYFFNLAPNYDLTITPTFLSKQGAFGDIEWRQRFSTGDYDIRVTGINQQNPAGFLPTPYGAGSVQFRSSVETTGSFFINEKWRFGWDVTVLSDRFYLNDYKIKSTDVTNTFYADATSKIFLRGQDGRGFFDLSAYRFQGLTANDEQRELPTLIPVLDYNKTIPLDPDRFGGIGGDLNIDANAAFISREKAAYRATGLQRLDQAFGLYNVCPLYTPGNCLLRGIGGEYTRASLQASWTRRIIDPLGEVWTPFAFARVDGETAALNLSRNFTYTSANGSSTVSNGAQSAFFDGAGSGSAARAMAGFGLDYRYPFVARSAFATQTFEPIAQLIFRPNEYIPKVQPNEDAQSLVFDETTLFAWNKFSGYDRVEGGSRFNYGAQYTADFINGGHFNVVGGQSIHVMGRNSFAAADAANTGLESGLDKKYSNLVAGETLAPFSSNFSLSSRQQWDSATLNLKRLDVIASATYGGLTASVDYGRYAAQPLLGWNYPREGLMTNASYKLTETWSVNGSLTLDLSRHFYDTLTQTTPRILPTSYGVGLAYADSCTTFKVNFRSTLTAPLAPAPAVRDQTVLVELDLRTLGDLRGSLGVK